MVRMRIEELDLAAAQWRPWEPPTWLVTLGLVLTLTFGIAHAEQAGGHTSGAKTAEPAQPNWVAPNDPLPCAVTTPPPHATAIRWFDCR